jgi:hypothetical protein
MNWSTIQFLVCSTLIDEPVTPDVDHLFDLVTTITRNTKVQWLRSEIRKFFNDVDGEMERAQVESACWYHLGELELWFYRGII